MHLGGSTNATQTTLFYKPKNNKLARYKHGTSQHQTPYQESKPIK